MRYLAFQPTAQILCIALTLASGCYGGDPAALLPPEIVSLQPGPVGNTLRPRLSGRAEPGYRVRIFGTEDCSGRALSTDFADAFESVDGIEVPVEPRSLTRFSARLADPETDEESECATTSLSYQHDPDAPATPVLTGTAPASPSSDLTPAVSGIAEPASLVELHGTEGCQGEPLGVAAADEIDGRFTIEITVLQDSTTAIRSQAQDAAGNVSACTPLASALLYQNDSTATVALTGTTPSHLTPSQVNVPTVHGTSEPGATVVIHGTAACDGIPLASTTADGSGLFQTTLTVPSNAATVLKATATDLAGNLSDCPATGLTYTHDQLPPEPPRVTGSTPTSPRNDNHPTILGAAEPLSSVELFASTSAGTADCEGTPLGTITSAGDGSFALAVDVADNSSTRFSARSTDLAGNTSPCSNVTFTYDEDSHADSLNITGVRPGPSGTTLTPQVHGDAEAGSTVEIWTWPFGGPNPNCEGTPTATGTAAQFNADGIPVPVAANTSSWFVGRTVDDLGNASTCSGMTVGYTHDSLPPLAPSLASTLIRTNLNSPTFAGGASEFSLRIHVYPCQGCACAASGSVMNTGSWDFDTAWNTFVQLADNSTSFYSAKAQDHAGNFSPCSSGYTTFIEDSIPPSQAPAILSVSPGPSGTDPTPTFSIRTIDSATGDLHRLRVYRSTSSTTNTCSALGNPLVSVDLPITVGTTTNVSVTAPDQAGQTTYYYRAATVDSAGNITSCSNIVSYRTLFDPF